VKTHSLPLHSLSLYISDHTKSWNKSMKYILSVI
jgi:hypothetical protein